MKFPWHKKHYHKPETYWPPVEPECEEVEDMAMPTSAKLATLAATNIANGGGVYNPAAQAQLPFGQPMMTNLYGYPNQGAEKRAVSIEAGDVLIKKARNGYLIHVYTTAYSEPTIYVCGDAEDVGETFKVALVNFRIDAAK
jgi:hypothetical protein